MKKIALVLGGGGARGLAHIHALEAFDDLGIKPDLIVGTSIGAVIGAGYAAGMSGEKVRDHAIHVFGNRSQVMGRIWRMRPSSLRSTFAEGMPRFGEINAERALRAFLPADVPEDFAALAIPLKVTATDFYSGDLTVLESGPLFKAIAASIAIPGLFRPIMIDGRVHIDGGIASAVAFELVRAPDYCVVAVDVVGMPVGTPSRVPGRLEAAFGASQLMMHAVTRMKLKQWQPDILIRPAINQFRVLDFLRARTIIDHTRPTRAELRHQLEKLLAVA